MTEPNAVEKARQEELLGKLDAIARDFDIYEFGLPWGDETTPKMLEVIAEFEAAIRADEREQCARVAEEMYLKDFEHSKRKHAGHAIAEAIRSREHAKGGEKNEADR